MSESYENILYREILEKLKRLEGENARLREHLSATTVMVRDLRKDLEKERKDTTHHIEHIYDKMGGYAEVLWPVAYKVFPQWAKASRDTKRFLQQLGATHPSKD